MTSAAFVTPSKPISADVSPSGFPKERRILRSSDFRKVYDEGFRFSCQHFAAFCVADPAQQDGPKAGFTVSRAMGKSVVRNRMRRRMREAVRTQLSGLAPQWRIVFNPRRPVLTAPLEAIRRDIERLFLQCKNS